MSQQMTPVKIGIVGCGAITQAIHLPEILRNPHFELVGLVDAKIDRAEYLAELFDVDAAILATLDGATNWDAVLVAVPPFLHHQVSLAALKQGFHVLCEKPLAISREEGRGILECAHQNNRVLSVVMQRFFNRNTQVLKTLLDSDLIGKIKRVDVNCIQRSQWNSMNARRFDPDVVPGGITFENGVHWIYRILHWFDDYNIISYRDDRCGGVEANAEVECELIYHEQKIGCHMYFSADHKGDNAVYVHGSRLTARIDDQDDAAVTCNLPGSNQITMRVIAEDPVEKFSAISHQYNHFHDLILGLPEMDDTLSYSMKALDFLFDCYAMREPWPEQWTE